MAKDYPMIDTKKTGQTIKRIMIENGYTVKDLQHYLRLEAPQSVYNWFYGKSLPTLDNLYALSELFKVPVDEMLRGNGKYHCICCSNDYEKRMSELNLIVHKNPNR